MLEHMLFELKHSVLLKEADYAPKYAGIMGLSLKKWMLLDSKRFRKFSLASPA